MRWGRGLGAALLVLVLQPGTAAAGETAMFHESVRFGEGMQWRFTPRLVDLNDDGRLDLVATHRKPGERNALHVWLQAESGELRELAPEWPSPGYSAIALGDLQGDGHVDIVAASHFSKLVTYLGDGKGGFAAASVMERDTGFTGAGLADLDGDGRLEAVILSDRKGGIQTYRYGNGEWTPLTRLWEGAVGRDLVLGDVNNDGRPDIVAAGGNDGAVVYVQDASGAWARRSPAFASATGIFQSVALGDVNGDGFLDIALNGGAMRDDSTDGPEVYLGDGTGGNWRRSSEGLKVVGFSARGVALGDMDGDGNLDLVAGGNPDGSLTATSFGLYLFRGDGAGGWKLDTQSGLPPSGLGSTRGIALGDLDADGKLDMVVSHGYTILEDRNEIPEEGGYLTVWRQSRKQD